MNCNRWHDILDIPVPALVFSYRGKDMDHGLIENETAIEDIGAFDNHIKQVGHHDGNYFESLLSH
jgi:hypothetical protein